MTGGDGDEMFFRDLLDFVRGALVPYRPNREQDAQFSAAVDLLRKNKEDIAQASASITRDSGSGRTIETAIHSLARAVNR